MYVFYSNSGQHFCTFSEKYPYMKQKLSRMGDISKRIEIYLLFFSYLNIIDATVYYG